jgi:dTDP-4-dehydrorhamnose 3,5-epimerase
VTLRIEQTPFAGLVLVHPQVHADARGRFRELYRAEHFAAAGLPFPVQQVNASVSRRGAVRGLHFQWEPPQAKVMRVARGAALLVAVDLRRGSPTAGRAWWRRAQADDDLWVAAPAGFARGFQAIEDDTEVEYLCDAPYRPAANGGIRWDDPALGIPWPVAEAIVSEGDRRAPTAAEWLAGPTGGVFAV